MTDLRPIEDELAFLINKVKRAGALAQHLKAQGLKIDYKKDGSIVTNGDIEVNRWLYEALMGERPTYGWLSEESPDNDERLTTKRTFVLDPIDGTMGFSKGSGYWTIALAIVEDGLPIAAVVYAPDVNELYAAGKGLGATLNGEPIHVSDTDALLESQVLGDARLFGREIWLTPWPHLKVASKPSIAYRMALIAAGKFDFTLALTPKSDWDVAAAALIVTEAGGFVSDHLGNPYRYNAKDTHKVSLICSNARLKDDILGRCAHLLDRHDFHARKE